MLAEPQKEYIAIDQQYPTFFDDEHEPEEDSADFVQEKACIEQVNPALTPGQKE